MNNFYDQLRIKKEEEINSGLIKSIKIKCFYKQHQIRVLFRIDQAFFSPLTFSNVYLTQMT